MHEFLGDLVFPFEAANYRLLPDFELLLHTGHAFVVRISQRIENLGMSVAV